MYLSLSTLICFVIGITNGQNTCTIENILQVGRIVYGEARGETKDGQLAVAWTIVNRINHDGYPSTLDAVCAQKASDGQHQYETLDIIEHSRRWEAAAGTRNSEYVGSIVAAIKALCLGQSVDPTKCATDFCALNPCPATSSNAYWETYNKLKIGNHWFVCRRQRRMFPDIMNV